MSYNINQDSMYINKNKIKKKAKRLSFFCIGEQSKGAKKTLCNKLKRGVRLRLSRAPKEVFSKPTATLLLLYIAQWSLSTVVFKGVTI